MLKSKNFCPMIVVLLSGDSFACECVSKCCVNVCSVNGTACVCVKERQKAREGKIVFLPLVGLPKLEEKKMQKNAQIHNILLK